MKNKGNRRGETIGWKKGFNLTQQGWWLWDHIHNQRTTWTLAECVQRQISFYRGKARETLPLVVSLRWQNVCIWGADLTGKQHLTCSSGLVQGVLLHDCGCTVPRLIPVPQSCVLWKQFIRHQNDLAVFKLYIDRKITDSIDKLPSTLCSSSCVCVSGTFFCCSGVKVPRANTTSTSALNCSCKIKNN